jgi:cellulose synthase/poly-beta-1,6-N-acetylglucosamine synthase-like glycosyltransferase
MNKYEQPLVSVLTPVYNGEAYLAECIESLLAQTYSNWEYTIVNNCSTDGTLSIDQRYARTDTRIHVWENETLLNLIANHHGAFHLVSAESKYCMDTFKEQQELNDMYEPGNAHWVVWKDR